VPGASLLEQIERASVSKESQTRAGEFAAIAKLVLANRGKISEAIAASELKKTFNAGLGHDLAAVLQACRGGREISRDTIQKAAATPSTLDTGAFASYAKISQGFVASLQNFGTFDRMLADMRAVPVQTGSIGAITTSATAYSLSEGSMKPVSRMSLTGAQQTPLKAHCVVVISQELAKSTIGNATALIQNEMQNSVAVVTDGAFLGVLTSGLSAATSTGATAESVLADIAGLLQAVTTGQGSKLYFITTSLIAKMLSVMGETSTNGQRAFPEMGAMGGTLCGIPVLVSDAVTAGQLILVDAAQVAAGSGDVLLQELNEASVQLDTNPDSPPTASTNFISLWQNNLTAIVVERYFVATRLTSTGVAIVSNSNSYRTGFSPP
jgi:HK97 family phage major capsid protein